MLLIGGGEQKKLNWQPLSLKVDTAIGSVPESYITLNYCVYKIFRTLDLQSWLWAQGHQDSNSSKIFRLWLEKLMSAVHLRLIPPWLILEMSLPCRCKELNQKHSEGEEEEMMKVVWEVLKTVCCSVWTQTYTGLVVSFAHLHDTHAPLHSAGDTELPYGDVNLVSASTGRRWRASLWDWKTLRQRSQLPKLFPDVWVRHGVLCEWQRGPVSS